MARKTTASTSPRSKKTAQSSVPAIPSQGGAEMADMSPSSAGTFSEVASEPRTAKPSTPVAINEHSMNHSSGMQSSSAVSSAQPAGKQTPDNQGVRSHANHNLSDHDAKSHDATGHDATTYDRSNLEEQIRERAYQLYLERVNGGARSGDRHQDWLDAEREVRSRATGRERKSA